MSRKSFSGLARWIIDGFAEPEGLKISRSVVSVNQDVVQGGCLVSLRGRELGIYPKF